MFLHERTGDARWAELFCDTADTLWSQLERSAECGCHFWTQDLYGRQRTYLDAVHGFVATASPLIRSAASSALRVRRSFSRVQASTA